MPLTLEQNEIRYLIRMDGQVTLTSAEELKGLLLEGLAAGKTLELDLTRAEEIDIAILQLLLAAGREAARAGSEIVSRASGAAIAMARNSGFDRLQGFPIRSEG